MPETLAKRLIVAEIGSVHDGSFGNACALVDVAASAGADAVKFQTHIASAETLRDAPMPPFFKGEPRYAYFERTGFSLQQWRDLKAYCEQRGVLFMSSPFSEQAVDLLEDVGVSVYKIPSGEVTNVFLLEKVAATGKPVLLSSGMSDWAELDTAVEILRPSSRLIVLQCSSAYPCPPESVGLNVLAEMRARYGVETGFSDHTLDCAAAFAAAALGASVIEKHITFSKLMYGSDARHSMEPDQFRVFCHGLKAIWSMADHPVDKNDTSAYREMKTVFEKSLVAARPVRKGATFGRDDIAAKKAGAGISVSRYRDVIGGSSRRDLAVDEKLSFDHIEPSATRR